MPRLRGSCGDNTSRLYSIHTFQQHLATVEPVVCDLVETHRVALNCLKFPVVHFGSVLVRQLLDAEYGLLEQQLFQRRSVSHVNGGGGGENFPRWVDRPQLLR